MTGECVRRGTQRDVRPASPAPIGWSRPRSPAAASRAPGHHRTCCWRVWSRAGCSRARARPDRAPSPTNSCDSRCAAARPRIAEQRQEIVPARLQIEQDQGLGRQLLERKAERLGERMAFGQQHVGRRVRRAASTRDIPRPDRNRRAARARSRRGAGSRADAADRPRAASARSPDAASSGAPRAPGRCTARRSESIRARAFCPRRPGPPWRRRAARWNRCGTP